jgi:electron transfer flavoprotein alpha subunit
MILVLIEHDAGRVSERSLEAVTVARRIADGAPVRAFAAGVAAAETAAQLGASGVESLLVLEDERLADFAPAAWAKGLAVAVDQTHPEAVLASGTDRGNEVMGHLAARTRLPLATNCTEVEAGESYFVTRMRWGGSLLEEARLTATVKLLTIAPHSVEPEPAPAAVQPAVETLAVDLSHADVALQVQSRERAGGSGIGLGDAKVVVSGGRGMGSAEGFALIEELAGLLDGAVGCSRVATSEGWRPHSDQVGLTGNRIAPDLYIACGISGAFQHMVGCKGAKHILAINKDPNAPIVQRADWAIIGDLFEIVPALAAAVREAKAAARGG